MRPSIRFSFLILILISVNIFGDDRGNARSTAMAFASMVSSIGTDAYGLNPANYDYKKPTNLKLKGKGSEVKKETSKPRWEFALFNVGGGYGSDSSIDFYNNYLSYLTIDRNKFVNLFTNLQEVLDFRQNILPGEQTQVNYDFELKWFSMMILTPKAGAINLTMSDKVGLNTDVFSRDQYLPLNFATNYHSNGSYDLTNVNLAQSEAIAWWIRKYSLGYAKKFELPHNNVVKSVSIGVSTSLVHGYGNVSTYESRLNISTYGVKNINGVNHVDTVKGKQDFHVQSALTDFFVDYRDGHEAQINLFPKPAGIGYSFDFGITAQLGDAWKVGASVTDLGQITWNYNTITNNDTNHFAYYNFNLTGTDPTYNAMVDDLGGYRTQDTGTEFKSDMHTKIRAGIEFQPSDKLMIEFDWYKGTNNLPGNSDANIFALGSEYFPVYFLPLRAGVSIGGPGTFYISLGTGVKFERFVIDIGTHGINQLFANKRFSVAISSKMFF